MPRWLRIVAAVWVAVGFAVWNGFFDLLVSRGEKEYLIGQARHEIGIGPPVTIDGVMSWTIHDALAKATIWGLVVLGAGLATSAWVRRVTVRELAGAARPGPDRQESWPT